MPSVSAIPLFRYDVAVLKSLEHALRSHHLVRPGDRLGVAVSGGADSVALLRALTGLAPSLGLVLFVLHLNHNLRGPESDADARFVRDLASQLSLESVTESSDVAALAASLHLSLEAAGRRARYDFFQRAAVAHRLDSVATAHTRDDQAETVLLRLLRGAGTSGLAGIHRSFALSNLSAQNLCPETSFSQSQFRETPSQPSSSRLPAAPALPPPTRVIRPLLSISRQQVEEFLRSLGQPFRQDASNFSPQFLRNRIRAGLLPALERDYNPALRQALCETAEVAAAENTFLDELADAILAAHFDSKLGLELKSFQLQPVALQRRILRHLCRPHRLALDFAHLEALRNFALAGCVARLQLPRGFIAEIAREKSSGARILLRPPSAAHPADDPCS